MSKDIKKVLKDARELLNQKEYNLVIKICKKVLKEDKRNYNALVLMAAAMREVPDSKSQVPNSLKKAIDIQPDNPLAWHGLLAHYGEQTDNESLNELIPVYVKLLQLEKYSDNFCKFLYPINQIVFH